MWLYTCSAFNQEEASVGAFSVIVKTDGSFAALVAAAAAAAAVCGEEGLGFPPAARVMTRAVSEQLSCHHPSLAMPHGISSLG